MQVIVSLRHRLNPCCSWTWTSTNALAMGKPINPQVLILVVVGRGLVLP